MGVLTSRASPGLAGPPCASQVPARPSRRRLVVGAGPAGARRAVPTRPEGGLDVLRTYRPAGHRAKSP